MPLRAADESDRPFLIEMARLASTLEGRRLPAPDDPDVVAVLPSRKDVAIVAVADAGERLAAAWCHMQVPPLLRDGGGRTRPELIVAVRPAARGEGLGAALLEAVTEAMRPRAPVLSLDVHLLNPAVSLYIRGGFHVAGAGRGPYGVAMRRPLGD